MSPPVGSASQEAAGASPRGKETARKLSPYVRVVNAAWNGSGYIKRKKAERYVKEGRADFVGTDQLRLIQTHPRNVAAATKAAAAYETIVRTMTLDELAHIPVVCPRIAYTDRSGPISRHFRGRSGAVRVLTSDGHAR